MPNAVISWGHPSITKVEQFVVSYSLNGNTEEVVTRSTSLSVNVPNGATLTAKVKALNSAGSSNFTSEVTAEAPSIELPEIPTGLTITFQ